MVWRKLACALSFAAMALSAATVTVAAEAAIPRGPHLAIVIGRRLLLVGPNGRPRREIQAEPNSEGFIAGGPIWSPDGRELAFWSPRVDQPAISLIGADGSDLRLADTSVTPYGPPGFDPATGNLDFVGGPLEPLPGTPRPTGSEIWALPPSGSRSHSIGTTDGFVATPFSFAPNGTAAATVFDPSGGFGHGARLVTFDPRGGPLHTVVPEEASGPRDPVPSPDGAEIAYLRYFPGKNANGGESVLSTDLMLVPFAGGTPTRIARIAGRASSLSWDPSGSRIAYATEKAVMEINSDGTCRKTVFSATVDGVAWEPGPGRGVEPLSCRERRERAR